MKAYAHLICVIWSLAPSLDLTSSYKLLFLWPRVTVSILLRKARLYTAVNRYTTIVEFMVCYAQVHTQVTISLLFKIIVFPVFCSDANFYYAS